MPRKVAKRKAAVEQKPTDLKAGAPTSPVKKKKQTDSAKIKRIVIEHWATALADDLRKEYGDLPIDLNPNPPRRGTFECTIFKDDDTEVLVWTGVKKGPPRKLKFPEDSDVVVKEIEKNLV